MPSGFLLFYDGEYWEVWKDLLVGFDPQKAEHYVLRIPVNVYGELLAIVESIGVTPFRPSMLTGITSARMDFRDAETDMLIQQSVLTGVYLAADVEHTQTITDPNLLAEIEAIFSNAQYQEGGCPFHGLYLTLTLASGKEVIMSLAQDGCDIFFVNGQFFQSRGLIQKLLTIFDQIPSSVIYG